MLSRFGRSASRWDCAGIPTLPTSCFTNTRASKYGMRFRSSSNIPSRSTRKGVSQVSTGHSANDSAHLSQHNVDTGIRGNTPKSYKSYLKLFKYQHKTFNPCEWLQDLNTGCDGLPVELDCEPLRVFDQGDVSAELAKKCLSTYIARTRRDCRTKSEAREEYITTKAGVSNGP